MTLLTPRPGTDGNHSCGSGVQAALEDSAAFSLVVDDPAFHAAGHGHDLARDVT
jgi:hypothetical protein